MKTEMQNMEDEMRTLLADNAHTLDRLEMLLQVYGYIQHQIMCIETHYLAFVSFANHMHTLHAQRKQQIDTICTTLGAFQHNIVYTEQLISQHTRSADSADMTVPGDIQGQLTLQSQRLQGIHALMRA